MSFLFVCIISLIIAYLLFTSNFKKCFFLSFIFWWRLEHLPIFGRMICRTFNIKAALLMNQFRKYWFANWLTLNILWYIWHVKHQPHRQPHCVYQSIVWRLIYRTGFDRRYWQFTFFLLSIFNLKWLFFPSYWMIFLLY